MPSLEMYKKILNGSNTNGQAHKKQSDQIMEATWYNDIASRTAYLYDEIHDDQFDIREDLHSERSKTKIPVEIKFFEIEYNSLAKDDIPTHIMFRPSYKPNVPYYDDEFIKPYNATFPIGLFCDIPDSNGVYHRWLIVGQYRHYSNQFPTYLVLPTNHKLQWIYKNKKYESWCVLRSQNSYNSGVWIDFKFQSPENQKIVWVPMNDKTKTIFYDQRIAISEPREQPVVWACSKVEDMNVKGIARYTFKQTKWNDHTDYIETDNDGNVIGMWCDYFKDGDNTPVDVQSIPDNMHSVITYSGTKPEIKINGSYKKFTVTFYKDDERQDQFQQGDWTFKINDQDVSDLIEFNTTGLEENQIKIKFKGDDSYIGKILDVSYNSFIGVKSNVKINIVGI